MLREGVQSWRCSLKPLGRKVTGKERGHPDTSGEQTPREGPGLWQARARENGFSGCREAGLIRLSLSKESGPWLPMPGGTQPDISLTFLHQDEFVQVKESLCSLLTGPLVLAGAAEGEVPHQPPQHGKLLCLRALMWQRFPLDGAVAYLGEERQRRHKVSLGSSRAPPAPRAAKQQPRAGQGCWSQVSACAWGSPALL